MKTILVDAVDTFSLENPPNRKILVTGANDEQFALWGLGKMPYAVFTLKHNPEKTDPKFFETLLHKFSLNKDDVVYFEHNPKAVESAKSVGIKTYYYDSEKKDLVTLKNFLSKNL